MKSWTIRRAIIYVLTVIAVVAVAGAYYVLPKGITAMQVYADGEKAEEEISIYEGTKKTISVTIEPKSFSDRQVTYQVADEEILTIDENGEISALKEGETLVTAQSVGFKQNITVKVESAVLDIKGLDEELTLLEDDGYTLEPKVVMASKELKAPKATFKSKDKSVATVDKNGYIIAVAPGETTITVSAGKITKKVKIIVEERPVVIEWTPAPETGGGGTGGGSGGGTGGGGGGTGGGGSGGGSGGSDGDEGGGWEEGEG